MSQAHNPARIRPKANEFRSTALVALGGNIGSQAGDPAHTLENAIKMLPRQGLAVRAISRFFRTPCFPPGAGPDYVNSAILLNSSLQPPEILKILHRVETNFGRERAQRWGMRSLDLDLLAVDRIILPDAATVMRWMNLTLADQVRVTPDDLLLPHPRLQDRAFVLAPLLDIAPDWYHPLLGKTICQLHSELASTDVESVVPL